MEALFLILHEALFLLPHASVKHMDGNCSVDKWGSCYSVVYCDATTDFMRKAVKNGANKKKNMTCGCVCLVVLGFWKGSISLEGGEIVPFYEACLMDGGRGIFRARIDQEMSDYVEPTLEKYQPGSLIEVTKFSLIWMKGDNSREKKMVMLVHHFSYKRRPPSKMIDNGCSVVFDRIDKDALSSVIGESSLVFLRQRGDGIWCSQGMNEEIIAADCARMGNQNINVKQGECDCQQKYGYEQCILCMFPIEEACVRVEAKNDSCLLFESWTAKEKREELAKHYQVNYLSLKCGRHSFPHCLSLNLLTVFPG